jgi:hypothetical protein
MMLRSIYDCWVSAVRHVKFQFCSAGAYPTFSTFFMEMDPVSEMCSVQNGSQSPETQQRYNIHQLY